MIKNNRYKKIKEALEILGLGDSATMKEIKSKFYELCHQWHPDKCKKSKNKCKEMIQKITKAHEIIIEYCNNYEYSFNDKEIKKFISYEELWDMKFGAGSF